MEDAQTASRPPPTRQVDPHTCGWCPRSLSQHQDMDSSLSPVLTIEHAVDPICESSLILISKTFSGSTLPESFTDLILHSLHWVKSTNLIPSSSINDYVFPLPTDVNYSKIPLGVWEIVKIEWIGFSCKSNHIYHQWFISFLSCITLKIHFSLKPHCTYLMSQKSHHGLITNIL